MFICHLNILPFSHKETKEVLDLMTRAESEYHYYFIVVSVNACLWDADKLPGEKSDRWPEVWHQLIHSKGKTPHLSVCQYNRACTIRMWYLKVLCCSSVYVQYAKSEGTASGNLCCRYSDWTLEEIYPLGVLTSLILPPPLTAWFNSLCLFKIN